MFAALTKEFNRKLTDAPEGQAIHLEAIFQGGESMSEVPRSALLEALNFELRWVQANALYELHARQGERKPLEKGAVLSLLGGNAWTEELLEAPLKDLGVQIAPFSSETTLRFMIEVLR